MRVSLGYSLNTTHVFDQDPSLIDVPQTEIDRAFPQVRLSSFSVADLGAIRATIYLGSSRSTGFFLSADGDVSRRAPSGPKSAMRRRICRDSFYKNLRTALRLVLAGSARLGLADPFPRPAPPDTFDSNGNLVTTISELPASERFFAGGDTTVRGYAVDTVGVPATLTPDTGVPFGGDSTIILNGELRVPIYGPVGGVFFMDGGNVFPKVSDLDVTDLRGSIGTGVRVKSPVGPIRFDIGFKLDRRVIGGRLEPAYAIHFSIGQAF